jgi:hypothetical protein
MVDTVPRLDRVFTEDRLEALAEGIPVTELPELHPWPTNLTLHYTGVRTDATMSGANTSGAANARGVAAAGPIIPPAPGP